MKITKKNLRIVFYGTPSFAVPTLEKLIKSGIKVVLVVTSSGRTPVKDIIDKYNLPFYQTNDPKDKGLLLALKLCKPNLGIIVAFKILPEAVYSFPKLGTFNIHASYLPDYRGAAPINWAIINGEKETGLSVFWLDSGIDTGRVIHQVKFIINSSFNFGQTYESMSLFAGTFCINVIIRILCGSGEGTVQETTGKEKTAPKLTRANTWIDWGEPARGVLNFIRGLSPKPGALSLVFGQECKILDARIENGMISNKENEPGTELILGKDLYIMTGDHWLEIKTLWKAGEKRPITGNDFVNGWRSKKIGKTLELQN